MGGSGGGGGATKPLPRDLPAPLAYAREHARTCAPGKNTRVSRGLAPEHVGVRADITGRARCRRLLTATQRPTGTHEKESVQQPGQRCIVLGHGLARTRPRNVPEGKHAEKRARIRGFRSLACRSGGWVPAHAAAHQRQQTSKGFNPDPSTATSDTGAGPEPVEGDAAEMIGGAEGGGVGVAREA